MSKIFRLQPEGSQDIMHWTPITGHYHDALINSITDPSNAAAQSQITSIPSPFARLDLVKSAFRYAVSNRAISGNTIYHKIISDCLDIAELFFNLDALRGKLEIIEWRSGMMASGGELQIDKESDLGRLENDQNVKHRLVADTLKMFLFQDDRAFNFSDMKSLFLLNYKTGPNPLNIIGGTSPASLFFSSANDLSYVDIEFGNHSIFSDLYSALHERSEAFILYLFQLKRSFENFAEKFPDLNAYFDLSFSCLSDNVRQAILNSPGTAYDNLYVPISVGAENNYAEVNGFLLRARNNQAIQAQQEDFAIVPTVPATGVFPLVLPLDPFSEEMQYAGGIWQKNYYQKVPSFDERPIEERTLPNYDHIRKPYLTISDFLQPNIIRLPFPVDEKSFFMGGYPTKENNPEQGYALPLKRKFFEYFTINDLTATLADGKRMFELTPLPDGVKATLRIPVAKGCYVSLSRLYNHLKNNGAIPVADERNNMGVVSDHQITLGIYPFVRQPRADTAHYRIVLAERNFHPHHRSSDCQLAFYDEQNPQQVIKKVAVRDRSDKRSDEVGSRYYIVELAFDFIEVAHHNSTNLIVPLFPPVFPPAKTFRFAIDFGTTNTHIEYQMNGEEPRAFDLIKEGHLKTLYEQDLTAEYFSANASTLGLTANQLTAVIREEFIPLTISGDSEFRFPQRSVIYDNGNFNPDEANFALADFNIPFWYLKELLNLKNGRDPVITPNLKWSNFEADRKLERRTRAFLKQLLLMIRNKVLVNNGDLRSTSVVVFYPSSMPRFRRQFLQGAWTNYYERYISGVNQLYQLSESFAPFQYFMRKSGVQAMHRPAVNIDIGGGTSDVVIYQNNQPILLSSFLFASNTLFGDGYGNTSASNGFVQKYEPIIRQVLGGTSARNLNQVYDNIKAKHSSSIELIEFFFSLEENKLIKDLNISLRFSRLLAEDLELRVVVLLYYSAIIYHIARLMKARGLELPRYLTFSGNGSKVIKMLTTANDHAVLTKFTTIIFKDVYGQPADEPFELMLLDNPKEATSKGGLLLADYLPYHELEADIREVLIGDTDNRLISNAPVSYQQLNDKGLTESVHQAVCDFIDQFFSWNYQFNYYNNFGISPSNFETYNKVLKQDLMNFLMSGIGEKQVQSNENLNIPLEETLFFYPLAGAINKLAYHIYKQSHS